MSNSFYGGLTLIHQRIKNTSFLRTCLDTIEKKEFDKATSPVKELDKLCMTLVKSGTTTEFLRLSNLEELKADYS